MSKTLIYIIISVVLMVVIAFIFSLFFIPKQQVRYESCVLLQNQKTGQVDCYGCVKDMCKDAPVDWVIYKKPAGDVAIPYACFESATGCQLAQ